MALRPTPLVVLTVAGLALALVTLAWIQADTAIGPPTDSAHHLFNAIFYARTLDLGGPSLLWQTMRVSYVGWPPAAYVLLYAPLAWLLGDDSQQVRMYGLALVPLLLWGTFHLGSLVCRDRRWGVLAAVLMLFSFGVVGHLRQVSIDLPAAAAALLALVALAHTRGLSRPGRTLLFGAACGLCLFTRVQSVFFLAGPVVVVAGTSLWRCAGWIERGRRLGWLAGAGLIAVSLSSPWWYGRLGLLWHVSTSHLNPARITPRGDPSLAAGLWHYAGALGKLAGWPTLLAAVAGLVLVAAGCRRRRVWPTLPLALAACVAMGVLGCALGIHREPRYLLPAVPVLAVLACLGLRQLPRVARNVTAGVVALAVVLPTLLTSVYPIAGNHWLARNGVVEWAYVRRALRVRSEVAAAAAALALQRVTKMDPRGGRSYLVFVQDARINFLPRLGSFLAPKLPELAFTSQMNPRIANLGWHLRQRKRRELFLMTEVETQLDLPQVWGARRLLYGNRSPIRLYRVPTWHKLRGAIDRFNVYNLTRKRR